MKIARICIHNFCSIGDLEATCNPVTILLGENNCGKSNILAALEFALSSSAKPVKDDLFAFRTDGDNLWVELTFSDLTLQEQRTFQKYVCADGSMCVRKTATIDEKGNATITYKGYMEEPSEEWLRSKNAGNYTTREVALATPLAERLPTGRLTRTIIEEAQRSYISEHQHELILTRCLEEGPFLGQRNVAAGLLPDFYLVPAVHDLDDEAKVKNSTTFGRLLSRAIEEMAASNPSFIKVRSDLETLVAALNKSDGNAERPQQLEKMEASLKKELAAWGVDVSIQIDSPDISKIFELGTSLFLDDGLSTVAQRKGHGLQRAVMFGLIKAWAEVLHQTAADDQPAARRVSESIVFGIEEPELFLHPQAQRTLAATLRQLVSSENHQVILCSHSSYFVDLDHYRDIIIASKPSSRLGTKVRQCNQELFEGLGIDDRKKRFHMAYWLNPDRGEMFFAKKVVFVEGETEKSLLPFLAQRLGCYTPDVSIVDCGSKHNLDLYIAIANAFRLQYHVLHDEDPLPDSIPAEWNDEKRREKRKTYELNEELAKLVGGRGRISLCCADFEQICGVSKTQGTKKGKALAALEHFQDLRLDEFPACLVTMVREVYAL